MLPINSCRDSCRDGIPAVVKSNGEGYWLKLRMYATMS
jgi:hypothetical protein